MLRLFFVLCAAVFSTHAFAASFDGTWHVIGKTTVGDCTKSVSGDVSIRDNRIYRTDENPDDMIGAVNDDGTAWAHLEQDGHVVRASGHLHPRNATGAWASNSDECGGTWTAVKQK
ncbi:hypothetical protein [Methylovirgula sp. 4M-Z18]|uniref:hypothetical protein n=1 Tax=Methylovirgula sp. 4M-Z18 TaxID=2293567 RepID=UPI000E2EBC99|nr:hypothetical protein [Methylovirgula sp. 4M-Z18]RFB78229.1 hypothetical protein DYH55_17835 [Methylovirgula sp. 4M-Z18]